MSRSKLPNLRFSPATAKTKDLVIDALFVIPTKCFIIYYYYYYLAVFFKQCWLSLRFSCHAYQLRKLPLFDVLVASKLRWSCLIWLQYSNSSMMIGLVLGGTRVYNKVRKLNSDFGTLPATIRTFKLLSSAKILIKYRTGIFSTHATSIRFQCQTIWHHYLVGFYKVNYGFLLLPVNYADRARVNYNILLIQWMETHLQSSVKAE